LIRVNAGNAAACHHSVIFGEGDAMITLDDMLDMACLTRDEIAAIALHEGLPEGDAARLGEYLMHIHHGPQTVQRMIGDDLRAAIRADDIPGARALFATLQAFVAAHPEAVRGSD
jgi:hypothetical protein